MAMLIRTSVPKLRPSLLSKCFYVTSCAEPLKKLFDSQKYFTNFNSAGRSYLSSPNVGLFENSRLKNPSGLIQFSEESLSKAKGLVDSMLIDAKNTDIGKLTYIRKLDQLSDILCRVIDVAEFIRVAHPSQKWVDAAQETHEMMFEYMNQLNTNVDLYKMLADILDSDLVNDLGTEEIEVGKYLRQDFERSGIAMDPQTRDNFVAITQEISLLGSAFNNDIHTLDSYWCSVPRHELESVSSLSLKKRIMDMQSRAPKTTETEVSIPLVGTIPYEILSHCPSEYLRKKVWIALHNSPKSQIKTLNNFIKYRALLANMMGYKSFSHYQLEHKMAKTPQNVITFLKNLEKSLLSKENGVIKELKGLYAAKDDFNPNAGVDQVLDEVKPWDRDYLLTRKSAMNPQEEIEENISEYLSVGTVMNGLDKLVRSIYNVSIVPERTSKGETWDQNQVRKLGFVDLSTNEHIGYLYVDFWSNKVLPSHFTIVCSRELNVDLGTESQVEMKNLVHLNKSEDYQLPVISLVCNFQMPKTSTIKNFAGCDRDVPTLLSLEQVDTIFHEMGHAIHSMLGRTKLHNLSGTRCSTDFVELPSVLMEQFSNDPRVLCKIAKHHQTGKPLSEKLLKQYQVRRDMLKECETYIQSKMALLDQVLHDENIIDFSDEEAFEKFDSTKIYHDLEKQLRVFSDEYSTWHGKFPHLFSYGAVYYSYLLDRAIADKIWYGLFKSDPWSREAGEKFKESVLKWGGTKDPWNCLADALGDEKLRNGDAEAMQIIGNL
ncbi:putative mitochondrial intermediate peptidase [Clavispora lusitaniae]|uniref:Mitochondrial intermediate peptidase n=1 Tax=Clavispora lusitaniae TaxID=36911 RepID=A0ACD0WGE0_CLALS|nr:putative mitochondrial intermediate peptidase [Clavispora lusitaniae]QFZ32109.1 putative mitochondrial intermediate peptidase [Clavispora lusitaniae]QFZ37778.1 putative mitochondrial intermediate peptidase [Clavispora lusitaniae]QFZ43462.1 putative mitochondrial intermediate peptidase [Clavispora lusitaniae]QFZ49138.1 putative mitochondrial intermediate peptidase [Clavispora lusitaniae]